MNKYGPKAQIMIEKTLEEFKQGKLHSGNSKEPVTDRDQAIAIGISKARSKHYKVPKESSD
jgi:hypothetical protein